MESEKFLNGRKLITLIGQMDIGKAIDTVEYLNVVFCHMCKYHHIVDETDDGFGICKWDDCGRYVYSHEYCSKGRVKKC